MARIGEKPERLRVRYRPAGAILIGVPRPIRFGTLRALAVQPRGYSPRNDERADPRNGECRGTPRDDGAACECAAAARRARLLLAAHGAQFTPHFFCVTLGR